MTFYFHNQGQKLADDSRGYRLSGPLAKGVSQNPDRLQEKKVNDIKHSEGKSLGISQLNKTDRSGSKFQKFKPPSHEEYMALNLAGQ